MTEHRDDLFTHIHKALRLALFDVTARAGRTDWGGLLEDTTPAAVRQTTVPPIPAPEF